MDQVKGWLMNKLERRRQVQVMFDDGQAIQALITEVSPDGQFISLVHDVEGTRITRLANVSHIVNIDFPNQ